MVVVEKNNSNVRAGDLTKLWDKLVTTKNNSWGENATLAHFCFSMDVETSRAFADCLNEVTQKLESALDKDKNSPVEEYVTSLTALADLFNGLVSYLTSEESEESDIVSKLQEKADTFENTLNYSRDYAGDPFGEDFIDAGFQRLHTTVAVKEIERLLTESAIENFLDN